MTTHRQATAKRLKQTAGQNNFLFIRRHCDKAGKRASNAYIWEDYSYVITGNSGDIRQPVYNNGIYYSQKRF